MAGEAPGTRRNAGVQWLNPDSAETEVGIQAESVKTRTDEGWRGTTG